MEASHRRLSVLSGQLAPSPCSGADLATISPAGPHPALSRGPAAASDGASTSYGNPVAGSAYASATGAPTSYARVHGEPSRAPAAWRAVPSVAREALTDVLYHKADGEGIAKVRGAGGRGRGAGGGPAVGAGAPTRTRGHSPALLPWTPPPPRPP